MSKLQVGDIVRYKRNEPLMLSIPKGSKGIIESKTIHGYACVNFNLKPTVQTGDLEYMGNQDPKTAFLTELKDLMEKYDAKIFVGDKMAIVDGKGDLYPFLHIQIGDDTLEYCITEQNTPSNIFDYDK